MLIVLFSQVLDKNVKRKRHFFYLLWYAFSWTKKDFFSFFKYKIVVAKWRSVKNKEKKVLAKVFSHKF